MNGWRLAFSCVIGYLLILNLEASPRNGQEDGHSLIDESKKNGSDHLIDGVSARSEHTLTPINGLEIDYDDEELVVKFHPRSKKTKKTNKKEKNAVEKKHEGEKKNIMKRIGSFMMMIPVGMQLLQLPLAIASVKFSLLRSILVAKVALLILLLRILFTPMPAEKIIVVRAPKEQHEHYYYPFEDPEDNKPGWFGKTPSWLEG